MTKTRLVLLLCSLATLAPTSSTVPAQPGTRTIQEHGIVVATDGEAGFLVLEYGDEYRYVIVDFAAPIHDYRGRPLMLRDVRGGDFVEYRVEWPEGDRLAIELRVTPSVDPTRLGAHR